MNNNNYARGLNGFIYLAMAIINVFLGATTNPGPLGKYSLLIAYYIVSYLFLIIVCSRKRVSLSSHLIITGVLMLVMSWGAGFNAGNIGVYHFMSLIPLITMMIYMDIKAYIKFLWIYYIQLILSNIVFYYLPGYEYTVALQMAFFIICVVIGFTMYYFLRVMEYRDKYLAEQEQSVNDLQKVIMAKCVEAKIATKSKSDFLSNMSHEIRTPLNAILGMNEMIMRENRDDTIAKYAGNVDRSGQMLLSLINDVLDFSKIESGKLELVKADYEFFVIAKDIITMLDSRLKKKELKLYTKISPDIPKKLQGDDVRIKQIITNIMTNAIKYTDEGSVEFCASIEGDLSNDTAKLKISISDTGQGMSEENVKRLFDSFSRFNQSKNRQIEGTGLGMAITKSLIDAMDGKIFVESELEKGSTFTVLIPQKIIDSTPSGNFEDYNTKENAAKKRADSKFVRPDLSVLVVDDSRVNLAVAKGLLKYTKMQTTTANSGQECIDKVKEKKFDIILLDHMMPQMDGIETLKKLREEKLCEETPVIALTANAVGNAKDMYLSHGFDDYLSKPISGESLEGLLRKWLEDEENA